MRARRGDIEGVRAIAVAAVVAYHAGWLHGGFVGVDAFFVVSGFLITGLLWDELAHTRTIAFAAFYARRARRLLPAAAVVLLATLAVSARVLSPLHARSVTTDAIAAATYAANYRFAAAHVDYLTPHVGPSPLQHFWSLGVEEQFYALWPLALIGIAVLGRRCSPRVAMNRAIAALGAIGAVSFLVSWWCTRHAAAWAFFSLPTRVWELVAGALLAVAAPRLRRIASARHARTVATTVAGAGTVALAASWVLIRTTTPFPGTAALLPVVGTAAIVGAGVVCGDHAIARALGWGPLQWVGRISYPLYLWHWPLLTLAAAATGRPLGNAQIVAVVASSCVLAAITTRVIEEPLRFGRMHRVPARAWLAGAATVSAFVVVAAVLTAHALPPLQSDTVAAPIALPRDPMAAASTRHVVAAGEHARTGSSTTTIPVVLGAVERAVASAVGTTQVPANLSPSLARAYASKAEPFLDGCDNSFTDAVVHHCVYGEHTARTAVVLFGDSHAAQWWPALDTLANERHWRLIDLSKATCPPIALTIHSPVLGREFWECEQWRDAAVARIAAEHPTVVIMASARHYGPEYDFQVFSPRWNAAFAAMVRRVQATGTRVVVLGPTPHPVGDVPDCLAQHVGDVRSCEQPPDRSLFLPGVAAERRALVATGAQYVDETPWFCTEVQCPVIVGNILVYRDDNHVTVEYARWLAPVFAALLRPTTG